MKPLFLGLLLSWINFTLIAQCPSAPLVLGSQADIDNFSINYPNCTQLLTPLYIDEVNGVISNLQGLSALQTAQLIKVQNTHIEHLYGFENLTEVQELWLNSNYQLLDFAGLESTPNIGLLNVIDNTAISAATGLESLTNIAQLNFFDNTSLTDLTALSQITQLNGLRIAGNNLTTLQGLHNLTSVESEIFVSNEQVVNLDVFSGLIDFNASLFLWNNPQLNDVSVFQGVNELNDLVIVGCNQIQAFEGFENLQQVQGLFRLGFNPQMTDLTAFSALNSVGSLDIYENDNLLSLSGLESLTQITQAVYLMDNPNLEDIQAIENVAAQGLQQVVISRNTNLTTCDNNFVCQVIFDPEINEEIQANANGCNSVPQVAARCILGSIEQGANVSVELWPNPVDSVLHIRLADTQIKALRVYSAQGRLIYFIPSFAPTFSDLDLDVSAYAAGLYFITLETNLGMSQLKFSKR
jgi:hypothetical protein